MAGGRSGDAAAYDLSTEVADIAAMMAVAGPDAHLLGHSYGAVRAGVRRIPHPQRQLRLFEPPLAVDGPVAGTALGTYRDLIAAGDLDAALEVALVNFVRLPAAVVPEIRGPRSGTPAFR